MAYFESFQVKLPIAYRFEKKNANLADFVFHGNELLSRDMNSKILQIEYI